MLDATTYIPPSAGRRQRSGTSPRALPDSGKPVAGGGDALLGGSAAALPMAFEREAAGPSQPTDTVASISPPSEQPVAADAQASDSAPVLPTLKARSLASNRMVEATRATQNASVASGRLRDEARAAFRSRG